MSTTILHRRGIGVPSVDAFTSVGEILIDMRSGIAYTLNNSNEVVPVGGDSGGDAAGAGMVISPTEPTDPVTGMQWLDSTTADVWIWDDDKWLQFPVSGGAAGNSGATYTLPVAVRGGEIQLPLNEDSTKLIVDTRSGPVELPLMAA